MKANLENKLKNINSKLLLISYLIWIIALFLHDNLANDFSISFIIFIFVLPISGIIGLTLTFINYKLKNVKYLIANTLLIFSFFITFCISWMFA